MASPTTRFWLQFVVVIEALFAFFAGVFFSVWGGELSSPVWKFVMSVPFGGRFWGTLFLIFGTLFLFGLDWERSWPRVLGCAMSGVLYCVMGIALGIAPLFWPDTFSGSTGMWMLGGLLTLCLAGFMWSERHQEILEMKRDSA